jgi:hypothetical protein
VGVSRDRTFNLAESKFEPIESPIPRLPLGYAKGLNRRFHLRWNRKGEGDIRRNCVSQISEACLRNKLGIEVGLDRFRTTFRAVARILHPAERHFRQREAEVVDCHHPSLHL